MQANIGPDMLFEQKAIDDMFERVEMRGTGLALVGPFRQLITPNTPKRRYTVASLLKRHLIVRADGHCRVTKAKPNHLRYDEVAFPIQIKIPLAWGGMVSDTTEFEVPGSDVEPEIKVEGVEEPDFREVVASAAEEGATS